MGDYSFAGYSYIGAGRGTTNIALDFVGTKSGVDAPTANFCWLTGEIKGGAAGYGAKVEGSKTGRLTHCYCYGETTGVVIGSGATLSVYADEWSSLTNLGTLIELPGDLTPGGVPGTSTQAFFYSEQNVSNPPIEEEIVSAFGDPQNVPQGFLGVINDNADESHVYLVGATITGWWSVSLAKAALMTYITAAFLVTDTYTGSAGTHLNVHTPEVGGAWVEQSGSWTLQAGGDVRNATAAGAYYIATQDIGKANAQIRAQVGTVAASGSQFAGVIVRYVDGSNFWIVDYNTASTSFSIRKVVSGTPTDVTSKTWPVKYQKFVTIEVTCNGNAISAIIDGGFTLTVTDSFNNTATKFGIGEFRDGTFAQNGFDNFQIVDLPTYPWTRTGTVLSSTASWESSNVNEPFIIIEGNPQILSGKRVWKMWYSGGIGVTPGIGYAESLDGVTWTKYSGNPILTNLQHFSVVKIDGVYWMYATDMSVGRTRVNLYTSPDGVNWTLDTLAVLSIGGGGAWDNTELGNTHVWREAENSWFMLYDGTNSSLSTQIWWDGLATSTDGKVWTKSGSNPVLTSLYTVGSPWLTLKADDGYYYAWVLRSDWYNVPSSITRYRSSNLTTWTHYPEFTIEPRIGAGEGEDTYIGQTADPFILEYNGTAYLYFAATSDGTSVSGNQHIVLATADARAVRGY